MNEQNIESWVVTAEGERLDVFIASVRDQSRSQIKQLIEAGDVTINGEVCQRSSERLSPGMKIELTVRPRPSHLEPYDLPLNILYEDESLVVVDKQAGLSMHPGAGNASKTLVNALIHHFRSTGDVPKLFTESSSEARPGVVHRLDQDTTGVVVVAKRSAVHEALALQFSNRTAGRSYRALAFTTPRGRRVIDLDDTGVISAPLGRHPTRPTLRSVLAEADGGRPAVTRWQVHERFPYGVHLELRLETGRTHQIRVHLASILAPVIGDQVYGDFSGLPEVLRRAHTEFGRQALHAARLEFDHPDRKERLAFESPMPEDMVKLFDQFRAFPGR